MHRTEVITQVDGAPTVELAPGVQVRMLATGVLGAKGLSTALATFQPQAELPYHRHPVSEVIVALSGSALVCVEDRRYLLRPHDAIHVPAETPHAVRNATAHGPSTLHTSFATDSPSREPVNQRFVVRDLDRTDAACPETLVRFEQATAYELAPRTEFRDLFARRYGARGICGGYGVFEPGASLPCHFHEYDESITIVAGRAVCQVAGREYELADCATACVPRGRPHRFLNRSADRMAMIWVYAGDEPQRTLVDTSCCEGAMAD
jgi:quercetin dioxygenase-like cupin family protein